MSSDLYKKWFEVGSTTEPINHAVAEETLRRAYAAAGLSELEEITWVDSPMGAMFAASRIWPGDEKGGLAYTLTQMVCYGQLDAGWHAFYERLANHIVDRAGSLMLCHELATVAHWWWAFKKHAIMCERPIVFCVDEALRPHCTTGPAIRYRDGFEIYAVGGVRVPQVAILKPTEITAEMIMGQGDIKVRSAMRSLAPAIVGLLSAEADTGDTL
jgi:hypothetical protein